MKTGFRGTFVIPWAQTLIDSERSPALDVLRPGVGWLWTGDATRVDGPRPMRRCSKATLPSQMRAANGASR